jgi:hypothetical protein
MNMPLSLAGRGRVRVVLLEAAQTYMYRSTRK